VTTSRSRRLPKSDSRHHFFDEAWETRVAGHYEGVSVHYVGREALMRNKAASGSLQDLADLAALR
jgi:hypothetical protein